MKIRCTVVPSLVALVLGCGDLSGTGDPSPRPGQPDSDAPDAAKPEGPEAGDGDGDGELGQASQTLAVANRSYLPECMAERVGELAYVKSQKNLYACLDGAWTVADISAAAVAGPPGPPGEPGKAAGAGAACKWCGDGESTFGYDDAAARYVVYTCVQPDADGCGVWQSAKTCAAKESVKFEPAEVDAHGFAARAPLGAFVCYDPNVAQGSDECASAADCGGVKWTCEALSTGKKCVERDAWASGTGTWDYGADHFSWPLESASVYATCNWGTNSYFHSVPKNCTVSFVGDFAAPEGGLDDVRMYLTVDANTQAGDTRTSTLSLSTDTNVATHTGYVTETLDSVTFSEVDLRPGGFVAGTWAIEGTVQGSNVVKASGQFRAAFAGP